MATIPSWMTYNAPAIGPTVPIQMQENDLTVTNYVPQQFIGYSEGSPYLADQEGYQQWKTQQQQQQAVQNSYSNYQRVFQGLGDTSANYKPVAGQPPKWEDFYNQFDAQHRAVHGIGIDRPWTSDAENIKATIDKQFLDALNKYNQTFGTQLQPNPEYLGVTAQPNSYTPKNNRSGGLGGMLESGLGAVGGFIDKTVGKAASSIIDPIAEAGGKAMDVIQPGLKPLYDVGAQTIGHPDYGPLYIAAGAGAMGAPNPFTVGGEVGMAGMSPGAPVMSPEYMAAHPETYGTSGGLFGFGGTQAPAPITEASTMPAGTAGGGAAGVGGTGTAGATGGGLFSSPVLATGLNLAGGYLQGESNKKAAEEQARAQIQAAQIAAEAAKFRPVGVTTRFGKSQFEFDPSGRLTGAGYTISPELKAQQDALMAMSGNALQQYQASQGLSAPMLSGAQRAMQLGQGYLASTPQEQATKYMAEQQALLSPSRAEQMSMLQNRLAQQGRLGVATGGGVGGMLPTSPEMAAYYNALRQQDLELASRATQAGQEYAKFGTGMLSAGGDLMRGAYGAQTAAFQPYQTALGGATRLEELGMQPMMLGSELGSSTTAAAAAAGRAQAQGISDAARYQAQATAMNPWANLFGGLGSAAQQYRWGQ